MLTEVGKVKTVFDFCRRAGGAVLNLNAALKYVFLFLFKTSQNHRLSWKGSWELNTAFMERRSEVHDG